MPSPIGHALGGFAAGWLVAGPPPRESPPWRPAAIYAALAMAPDLDLLTASHRGVSHSVGAAAIAAVTVWTVLRLRRRPATRLALACGAAWGSHVLLDWLGTDTSPPFGLMALWPFSTTFYEAPFHLFASISRRVGQPAHFWLPNLLALLRELALLAPVAILAARMRGGRVLGRALILSMIGLPGAVPVVHAAPPPDRAAPEPGLRSEQVFLTDRLHE